MSPAMSQMILTDSDASLLLWWFEAVVLLEASTLLLLPPTVHMKRCRKVPSVFIPPSVIFSPLSFLILCLGFFFRGRAGSELTNRDSVVLSLPRRDGNITQQRERQSQRSVLLKTMPASDCVILCDMDVQILCKCAERISQFQTEYLTSDTLCEAADQSFTHNKTSLKQDRTDSDDFSVHRALRLLKTLTVLFVSRC